MSGIVSAAGAVVGGLLGFGGSILGGKSSKSAQKRAHAFEAQRIRMMAKDAKLAGIHPLAALGVASSYQNPVMGVPSSGYAQGLGALGQGLSQAATDYAQGQKSARAEKAEGDLLTYQKAESKARMAESLANADLAAARAHAVRYGVKYAAQNPQAGYSGVAPGAGMLANRDYAGGDPIIEPTLPATATLKDARGSTKGPHPETAMGVEEWIPYLIRSGYLNTKEAMNKIANYVNERGGNLPGWRKGRTIETNEDARDFLRALRKRYKKGY